ncbi:MAG: right-handed parallel beta-helix repeat-containing protein [bacterium]
MTFFRLSAVALRNVAALPLALAALPAGAAQHSVRPDGAGDYPTIQAAVDASAPLDEIILEDGTFTGPGNRDIRFAGKDLVVRSRDGNATCKIDTQGSLADPHRAFRLDAGETQASRIEGITITGGYVTGAFPENGGGGILVEFNSSPVIANCIFDGNQAGFEGFGAGLLAWTGCDLTITDCVFRNGVAGWYGGGFVLRLNCAALVERCLVIDNSAGHAGGGISITRSNAIVNDCQFIHNHNGEAGGGGVLVKADAQPVFTRCVFAGNDAFLGGGLGTGNNPHVTVIECLFENNLGWYSGGALGGDTGSQFTVQRCTFVNNRAPLSADIYFEETSSATVRTSIFGRRCQGTSSILANGPLDIDCCVIQGGAAQVVGAGPITWGAGNVGADPLFCSPDPDSCATLPSPNADYSLSALSPAAPSQNPCGLVGAYPVACGPTSAGASMETVPWSRVKARYR